MTEKNATRAAGSSAPACSHMDGSWDWRPRGFARPPVPAYAVYCSDCDKPLFTLIYDAGRNEHRVGVPNFHMIEWQEYVLGVVRKRFPNDRVVIANDQHERRAVARTLDVLVGFSHRAGKERYDNN